VPRHHRQPEQPVPQDNGGEAGGGTAAQGWLTDDAASLELLIRQRRQTREKALHQQLAEYFSNPPTFPLNWADNKLSREEMNER
jgi:hypothetical protein